MLETLQFVGAGMVLGSYFAMRRKWLDPDSVTFILLNALGAGLLAFLLILERDWGILMLEGAWSIISFWDLPKALRRKKICKVCGEPWEEWREILNNAEIKECGTAYLTDANPEYKIPGSGVELYVNPDEPAGTVHWILRDAKD